MPITVEIWRELKDPGVEARVTGFRVPAGVIDDPRFPLLRWIDPWGDTVFNSAQSAALVPELNLLSTDSDHDLLPEIRDMAMRVANEPHLYLVFSGD